MSIPCRILLICDDDLLGREIRGALGESLEVAVIPATGKAQQLRITYQEMVLHGIWEMPVRGAQFDLAIVSLVGGTVAGMLRTNPLSPESVRSALYLIDPEMTADEAWRPRAGCRDVIVHRPIGTSALRAHVIELLLAGLTLRNPPEDNRILAFLGSCIKRNVRRFDPIDAGTSNSRNYPEVMRFFGPECASGHVLKSMSERGLLSRRIVDRSRCCSSCSSQLLQFSEVCPTCRSPDYARVPVIHHFACGHVDDGNRFRQGDELVCPKCSKTLRQIGRDYERPAECIQCAGCGGLTPEPMIQVYCGSCKRKTTPDQTSEAFSYAFELTPQADEAVKAGTLTVETLESVLTRRSGVCSKSLLHFELERELARNKRYQSHAALLFVHIDGLALLRIQDPDHFNDHLERCCTAITRHVRDLDLLSIWEEDTLAIILPETPESGAQTVAERIRLGISAISPVQSSLHARIGLAMVDPDYASATDLIEACMSLWNGTSEADTMDIAAPADAGQETVSASDSQMPVVVLEDDTLTMPGPPSTIR